MDELRQALRALIMEACAFYGGQPVPVGVWTTIVVTEQGTGGRSTSYETALRPSLEYRDFAVVEGWPELEAVRAALRADTSLSAILMSSVSRKWSIVQPDQVASELPAWLVRHALVE